MGFFSSGFGRILAGVGTMGLSEAIRIPGIGQIAGSGVGTALGGPIGGAIGGALGSSAQSMLGFGSSSASQDAIQLATAQNMYNSAMTKQQMDFQERMSSTAHQREVADLRAAGLNPILSANHGGSSSPSGAAIPAVDISATVANSALKQQEISNQFLKIMSEVAVNATQATKNITETSSTHEDVLLKKLHNLGVEERLNQLVYTPKEAQGKNLSEQSSAYERARQEEINTEIKQWENERQEFMLRIIRQHALQEVEKTNLLKGDLTAQTEQLKELKNKGKLSEGDFGLFLSFLERIAGIGMKLQSASPYSKLRQ